MLNFSQHRRVLLFLEPVDMRKSFRGLCLLAESVLQEDPASGHWFVFINRRGDRLKLLAWEGDGFAIYYKRLEIGVFEKPVGANEPGANDASGASGAREIDLTQLSLILQGIELQSAKRRRRYRSAG